MKISLSKKNGGYVLMIVMGLGIIGMMFMAGAIDWSQNTATMTSRNNEYFTTSYAAEAATERALANLIYDFRNSGQGTVLARLDTYRALVPVSSNGNYWTNYQFNNGNGTTSRMSVGQVAASNTVVLAAPYSGLFSVGTTYQVVADAKNISSRWNIPVGVGQEVNLGVIPIFQFAIFYEDDLEIRPGPNMTVSGLVHGNADIYLSPGATLTFSNDISSSGAIYTHKKTGDQQSEGGGTTVFLGQHYSNVALLNLPVDTSFTNGPHGMIDVPPSSESPTNGTNRLYNQVDLIVLVTNNSVTVKSGIAVNNGATSIPQSQWTNFLRTNISFYNLREASTVRAVTLDVGKLKAWSATNTTLRPLLGNQDVSSIFIADLRSMNATQQSGICLTNGKTLPTLGLTVVTPDPAYTIGDYNTSDDGTTFHPSTSDTTHTRPAAIMCDAINVLSGAFNPLRNTITNALNSGTRDAIDTTVNAAFLSGIVETTNTSGGKFSGGVENFPRFLEDWSNHDFTYNGSMVEMFDSAIANSFWITTGDSANSYNPPTRDWNFDENFLSPGKAPPLTPSVKSVSVPRWVLLAPNTTNF